MVLIGLLLAVTCVTGIGSGALGAGIASLFDIDSNRTASVLLSFAAGIMLSVICFDFIPEALELREGWGHVAAVLLFIVAGVALVAVLGHVIDRRAQKRSHCCALDDPEIADRLDEKAREEHMRRHDDLISHDHEEVPGHTHIHAHHRVPLDLASPRDLRLAGIVMALAIALHNLPAGISVGASFSGADGALVRSGIMIAILIGVHSIPESMSLAVPFLKAGVSKPRTLLIASAVGAMMVVGGLIGFALGEIGEFWLAVSLAFASGAMLYVLFGEILPESFLLFHSKKPAIAVIAGLVLGLLLVQI
ncbi:MAG: ZIP family metal transporter [Coriobacteriales bacterium]